jgi:hypothetical protein
MPLAEAFEMTRSDRVASLPGAVRTHVMSIGIQGTKAEVTVGHERAHTGSIG